MGKLDLRTLASIPRVEASEGRRWVKGSAEKSRLFQRITDKSMPPTDGRVTEDEVRDLRAWRNWIDGGAKTAEGCWVRTRQGRKHPLGFPTTGSPGSSESNAWRAMRTRSMRLCSPDWKRPASSQRRNCDKRTLLRRVYLDLIGLLPTLEEQQAFLNDPVARCAT